MPADSNNFDVNNFWIDRVRKLIKRGNREFSLPEGFGDIKAAAATSDGLAFAIVPVFGQPQLLAIFDKEELPVSVALTGIVAEWTAVAFAESGTSIIAQTAEGNIFAWPFHSKVEELERLAKNRRPVMRDKNGMDGVDRPIEVTHSYVRKTGLSSRASSQGAGEFGRLGR
jgi:hypothetical protein